MTSGPAAASAQAITGILDQLAAKVIYSREHLLENAYLVQTGDTLDGIADRYKVPAILLAKINGIRDPQDLPPGRELKVLKGPFSARISTDRSEMTMMLGGRYAGRFKVRLSDDLSRASGMFTVDKEYPGQHPRHEHGQALDQIDQRRRRYLRLYAGRQRHAAAATATTAIRSGSASRTWTTFLQFSRKDRA